MAESQQYEGALQKDLPVQALAGHYPRPAFHIDCVIHLPYKHMHHKIFSSKILNDLHVSTGTQS